MVTDSGRESDCREKLVLFNKFAELGKRTRFKQSLIPATADGTKSVYFTYNRESNSEFVAIEFPSYKLTLVRHKHSTEVASKVEISRNPHKTDNPFQAMPLDKLRVIQKTIDDFDSLMLIRYWFKCLFS